MSNQAAAQSHAVAAPAITATTTALLQRTCDCGQHTIGGQECDDCKKKKGVLQRYANNPYAAPKTAPPLVHEVLRSPGDPMDFEARKLMETRLGYDFSRVRIHTDDRAAESARAVGALAYTVGRHIVFGQGQYKNASHSGRRLLQHELVHTVQQAHVSDEHVAAAKGDLEIGAANDPREHEANARARMDSGGDNVAVSRESPVLRRQPKDDKQPEAQGPAAYDGCPDPKAVETARSQAKQRVAHAVEVLQEKNIQKAAPLLTAHFHLDLSKPESAADIKRIRDQFDRMNSALSSGIRIFCRSAPRTAIGGSKATMPVDDDCLGRAHSTSCAAGAATATVILCESALADPGEALVKTIIHEFAHVACNGNPSLMSGGRAGGEIYYSDQLPGSEANVLNQAESYAGFAMQASSIAVAPAEAPSAKKTDEGPSHAGWWALLGVAAGLGIAGIFAHGFLVGAGLAGVIGLLGVLGVFDSSKPKQPAGSKQAAAALPAGCSADDASKIAAGMQKGLEMLRTTIAALDGFHPGAKQGDKSGLAGEALKLYFKSDDQQVATYVREKLVQVQDMLVSLQPQSQSQGSQGKATGQEAAHAPAPPAAQTTAQPAAQTTAQTSAQAPAQQPAQAAAQQPAQAPAVQCHTAENDDTCNRGVAYMSAVEPGQDKRNNMVFCPRFFKAGNLQTDEDRGAIIIHEIAHALVGGEHISDRAYSEQRFFPDLTTAEALTNADSYRVFVLHVAGSNKPRVGRQLADVIEGCDPKQEERIGQVLHPVERWVATARKVTHDRRPEWLADKYWTMTRQKFLGGSSVDVIDAAANAYDSVAGMLGFMVLAHCHPQADPVCPAGTFTASVDGPIGPEVQLCPDWLNERDLDRQAIFILAEMLGNAGVQDQQARQKHAEMAKQLFTDLETAPPLEEILGTQQKK